MRTIVVTALAWMMCLGTFANSGVLPNKLLSAGKQAFTSSGKTYLLTDGLFDSTSFQVSDGCWIALKLEPGPEKIFLTWNNPAYSWMQAPDKCKQTFSVPVNYVLEVSSNSTNGLDGAWKNILQIASNEVTSRGHLIDFKDAAWVRMHISTGGGSLDEIEIFDATSGINDTWFFLGTSITANTFKGSVPRKNFADLVHITHPAYTPAIVRGGVPCITSSDLVNHLSTYLSMAGDMHIWAIEIGTNDGFNNGNSQVATFRKNLQLVIDSCKKFGIQVLLARPLATNPTFALWQIHPEYLKMVDELTRKNHLPAGPDFYNWFLNHPEDLEKDGIHPNASGAASIQKLWAEKARELYKMGALEK